MNKSVCIDNDRPNYHTNVKKAGMLNPGLVVKQCCDYFSIKNGVEAIPSC